MSYPDARRSPPRAGYPQQQHHPGQRISSVPWPPGSSQRAANMDASALDSSRAPGGALTASASMRSVSYKDPRQHEYSHGAVGYNHRSWAPEQSAQEPQHVSWNGRLPTQGMPPTAYGGLGDHRDRLPTSQSMSSVSTSAMRGGTRRAPAPAALDLSHHSSSNGADQEFMDEAAYFSDRRPDMQMPVPRPLPNAPSHQSERPRQVSASPQRVASIPFPGQSTPPNGRRSSRSSSGGTPLAVPSSYYGGSQDSRRTSVSDPRASVATNGDRLSIDSYYMGAASGGLSPGEVHTAMFAPSTPEDPSSIDRRGLIGVGELATPRWAAQDTRHLRTPSMPHDFSLTPPISSSEQFVVGSASSGRNQFKQELQSTAVPAVNVMESVSEESPRRERVRHRSVSHASPARNNPEPAKTTTPPRQQTVDSLVNSIGDFNFESSIDSGGLAASLAMPHPPQLSPRRNPDVRASAPPAPKRYSTPNIGSLMPSAGSPPPPLPKSSDFSPPVPGSARERLYARRAHRQQAASTGSEIPPPQMVELPSLSYSNLTSPPDSADSYTQSFGNRKTPPIRGDRDSISSRRRTNPASPSAPHHDILRHIAPKDFSHLPPSPSTASINQFLKGSSSGHNLSAKTTQPGSISSQQQFTKVSGLSRSESMRSARSRAQSMKAGEAAATSEALRKLDGLSSTPSKKASFGPQPSGTIPKTATSSARSSPPPDAARRLTSKASASSMHQRDKDSLPSDWYATSQNMPQSATRPRPARAQSMGAGTDVPQLTFEKRESSPSVVGTPSSRDSHNTPPSGATRAEKAARRPSFASDVSSMESGAVEDRATDGFVPPVPPLPRGYMSMRQGLSGVAASGSPFPQPVQHQPTRVDLSEDHPEDRDIGAPTTHSVFASSPPNRSPEQQQSASPRQRRMSKKWSFSSALNLNKLHGKDKESSASPTLSPPSFTLSKDSPGSPRSHWTGEHELASPLAAPLDHVVSRGSIDHGAGSDATRSAQSVTPIAPSSNSAIPMQKSTSKRNTTSIPFFRRSSASSISLAKLANEPTTPRYSVQGTPTSTTPSAAGAQRTPSGTRKSMLGMHIPSMLRGSSSKRGLAQQAGPQVVDKTETAQTPAQAAPVGRRSRGMTLSSGGDQQAPTPSLTRKPSVDARSVHTQPEAVSVNGNGLPTANSSQNRHSRLPAAGAPPSLHSTSSVSSLRKSVPYDSRAVPSATPTKIPRMASRPSVVTPNTHGTQPSGLTSMPPPAVPQGSISSSRSVNVLGNSGGFESGLASTMSVRDVTEFGAGAGAPSARQSMQPTSSSASHRAHLLAPMSARKSSVTGIPAPPSATQHTPSRRETMAVVPPLSANPPSRRTLPQIPSSATSMTISAAAKARPVAAAGRRGSGNKTPPAEDTASQIKTSKSFHSKAAHLTGHSRLSMSSSVGGSGNSRRTSFATETSESPTDDEESAADSEMAAYVARRKARAATASGSKKDDLSDLIGFPDPIEPASAVTQRAFISRSLNSLSDYERKEVLDFDFIYYVAHNVKRPRQPDGKTYNHGYDDERGDYVVVEGDHLCYRYEVIGILGKGSFGQVVHCRDHKTGGSAAVKIIRNKKRFHAQALVEVKILQQIVEWDPEDKHYMVKMTDHFYFRGHLCIVTELLSINLYELIKANSFAGFSPLLIRRFTVQMLQSLMLMRSHRIVHCDLKPENILLRHPAKSGIKVIDFGSSCHESEKVFTYIQSRFYRSPEVILGMNYAMAIDMWSLGCILAELYTGYPIFPGENEHEQLACIMEVLGVPDAYIVQKASRRKLFFDATGAPRPFVNNKGKRRRPNTKTLSSVLKCNDEQFIDFISKCLTWDPDKRLKPQPAMRHPWILARHRRMAPPPPEREGLTSLLSTGTRRTANGDKKMVISPPTPLVARVPAAQSASRNAAMSNRLARNSTYVPNAQKISLA